jgi:hypothetical protein
LISAIRISKKESDKLAEFQIESSCVIMEDHYSGVCVVCNSVRLVNVGFSSSLDLCKEFFDEQGNFHVHNTNITFHSIECQDCKNRFQNQVFHKCWCGWSSENPNEFQYKSDSSIAPLATAVSLSSKLSHLRIV